MHSDVHVLHRMLLQTKLKVPHLALHGRRDCFRCFRPSLRCIRHRLRFTADSLRFQLTLLRCFLHPVKDIDVIDDSHCTAAHPLTCGRRCSIAACPVCVWSCLQPT
jgi:hypothetical protein